MADFVARQLAHSAPRGVQSIVQIGGSVAGIQDYLTLNVPHILLAPGDPTLVSVAQQTAGDDPRVVVNDRAINARGGAALLRQYSMPGLHSLRTPLGIKTLFPGLVVTNEIPLQAMAVTSFLDSAIGLASGDNHVLRLGLTGEEHDIVTTLGAQGMLARFSHVFVTATVAAAFHGTVPGRTLVALLESYGYVAIGRDTKSDPELPEIHMARSAHAIEAITLRQTVKTMQAQINKQTARLEKLEQTAAYDADKKAALERLIEVQENDLEDLQRRFGTLIRTNQELQNTLGMVQTRLAAAADYLESLDGLSDAPLAVVAKTKTQRKPGPKKPTTAAPKSPPKAAASKPAAKSKTSTKAPSSPRAKPAAKSASKSAPAKTRKTTASKTTDVPPPPSPPAPDRASKPKPKARAKVVKPAPAKPDAQRGHD